ncbi:hypothetical protein [Streptomyces violarus]|uniref:hypothetical protein n=1 Tax=Streptomyces violarus TaxID=67380 RepID=UPI0021C060A3|nr:hypothetical protein [Streptomyces violarus]MCT9141784.1 hypothetical protein [Streptomyces violarus]
MRRARAVGCAESGVRGLRRRVRHGHGDGELPPAFSVEAATAEETVRVDVLTAVTGGIHLASGYDLSTTVLQRLADGGAEIGDLLTHRSARRHRLLDP